jgi:hypothetical protein
LIKEIAHIKFIADIQKQKFGKFSEISLNFFSYLYSWLKIALLNAHTCYKSMHFVEIGLGIEKFGNLNHLDLFFLYFTPYLILLLHLYLLTYLSPHSMAHFLFLFFLEIESIG